MVSSLLEILGTIYPIMMKTAYGSLSLQLSWRMDTLVPSVNANTNNLVDSPQLASL